jgi:hypothetical protein
MRDGRPERSVRRTAAAPRIAAACLAGAALALALASCGGGSPAATARSKAETRSAPTSRTPAELARQRPRPVAAGTRCEAQVGGFLDAMGRLRRDLAVGLSYEQYVGELRAVRRAYAAIPTDRVALGCLRATGTPAERGLNEYIAASNTWTDCVEVPGCEAASIEGELQGQWRLASGYLSKAQKGLRQLGAS